MRIFAAAAFALLILHGPARAAINAGELGAIYADAPPGAALPMTLNFLDERGRQTTLAQAIGGVPAIVIFADYTCHTLCGPILEFAAAGLAKSGLRPGADYRVVVIGLDPKDSINSARAMRSEHFAAADPIADDAVFLTGTQDTVTAATAALGYHYRYDAEHDQFAHPAAVYVTDATGKIARVLSGLGLDGGDLRLALVDAGRGTVGTFTDHIRLLCYGFDPARGIYTERITFFLELAAGATVLMLGSGILTLLAMERRKAPS